MNNYRIFPYRLIGLLLLLCLPLASHAEVTAKLQIPSNTLRLGEQIQIKLQIQADAGEELKNIILPKTENFQFVKIGSNQGTSVQIINGKAVFQRSLTVTFQLIPLKAGEHTIGKLGVSTSKGNVFASEVPVKVLDSNAPRPTLAPDQQKNQYGIIYQAELNKEEEVYVGEEILLTYTIYTPASRENRVHQIQQPTPDRSRFQNFWLETFEMGEDYKQTVKANNQVYYKFPLIRYILYPLTTGEQTISPSKIVCQVGRGRSSFFNFPIGRTVNVPVYSNPISLKVKPLPEEGKPAMFKGAVGQYKLNSEVDTTQVNVGDAVTLKVTLTGNGNLKNVPEPIMPDLSKFDSYDPVKNNKIDVSLDGVSGSIEYSYVLVPHDVKANRIEPVQFAYFDPKEEKYHTLKTNPIVLSVQPSPKRTVGVGNGMNRRIITMLGEDFRFNVVGLKALASVPLPIYRYITAWLLLLIPILALLAVLIVKQRETFLALNPAVARSRKAPRLAKKYLTEANNSLQKGETQTIYAQLSKALNDYISNRWSISSTGMTSGELRDTLAGLGVQPGTIQKVIGLFEQFDGYRFANTDIDAQQARQDIAQTETALTELMQQKTNK